MRFCSMYKRQYTRQEFGHHQSTQYRMFPLPKNFRRLKESATVGNQFGWPFPKCPPCAESSSSAPAKAAAHAANVPNKFWTARHCVNAVAQKVNLRVRGICKGFRNEQMHSLYDQIWSTKSRGQFARIFPALQLQLLCLCYRPCKDWVLILWCGFNDAILNAVFNKIAKYRTKW